MPALKDGRHEAFARLVASGKTNKEAAIGAGYEIKWASSKGSKLAIDAKVRQRIAELQDKIADKAAQKAITLSDLAISSKINRIEDQNLRWALLKQIRDERAAEFANDAKLSTIAGGKTGLIVRQLKALGSGHSMRIVPEFVFDAALYAAFQKQEEQTQKELGQLIEKRETKIDIKNLSDEDLEELASAIPDDITG